MRQWRETIAFDRPLTGVVLRSPTLTQDQERLMQEREQAAFERGRIDGERKLGEQLLRQRQELLELQSGVLSTLRQAMPQVIAECEQSLLEVALETARKLVADLPISVEMVEAAVREALAAVEDHAELTVCLNAADLQLLERMNAPVLLATVGGEKLHFQASPEVGPGGCLVQTRFGVVDARRETKLELIRKSLAT